MSLPRRAPLRLAHSAAVTPVQVLIGTGESPRSPGAAVRLLPMSTPAAVTSGDELAVHLPLPGLGGRYLAAVVRRAAALGWPGPELAALAGELAPRCGYLLSAPRLPGLVRRPSRGRRHTLLAWSDGGWSWARRGAIDGFAPAAAARGAVCVAAMRGQPPRRLASAVDEIALSGVEVGRLRPAAGQRWTVELLSVPRLTGAQLQLLRERFAAAPRCDWCGVPVSGRHCRRCSAEPVA